MSEEGEDRACDFLHVGSGWSKREPLSLSQAINFLKCDEKLQKLAFTYSASLAPQIDAAKSAAEASKQSDFDYLSLGPGCPWLDVTDFHI